MGGGISSEADHHDERARAARHGDAVRTLAERIAREAHAGQREESTGDDYIHHIERVVALVEGDQAKAVAWLHDVLEDTPLTVADLRCAGISAPVVIAVELLTRTPPYDNYAQYIDNIRDAGNPLALEVKLADLRDHLRPNCPARLRSRYERALVVLDTAAASPRRGTP